VVHQKTFFSFLMPSSTTESGKTSLIVAQDVVHDEFSRSLEKSMQIRNPVDCRAQMAAFVAFFFSRSCPLFQPDSRSLIELFMMLVHESYMSSSLNDECFYSKRLEMM
jgi:hypothetical protein